LPATGGRAQARAPGAPWRRPPNLASALTYRRRERDTEALPQTPAQKYRLIYLSARP